LSSSAKETSLVGRHRHAHNRLRADTDTSYLPRYVRSVDVVDTVLKRLERIDGLERSGAARPELLLELRHLVREAEAWARTEGDDRARAAVGKLRKETGGMR
jgi:hypothetical protein